MQCIAFVLASVLAVAESGSVNYCGSRMCRNTNAHTFCQFPEGPGPRCEGYISARLTLEEKARLIARLNRRRNEAALGRMRGLPSAGNMLKMRWVEELAREAQRWADQCRPPRTVEEHDVCRDLYSISVGQCVASVVGEAPGLRVESMVDIWYMQSMLYKGNVTFYMPPNPNASYYGDFAQIIWAKSYMVGCGRSRFMTPLQGRLRSVERLVCNIAPLGPIPARPLWAPAAPAASCPLRSRRDEMMHALCDYQTDPNEIMHIDASMSLEDHLLLNTILDIENNATIDDLGILDQIYLTRLAIATMENTISTQMYYTNSMQRREVIEMLDLVDDGVNMSTSYVQDIVTPEVNTTIAAAFETTTVTKVKTTKKKISLIGRPKTYNMEDLTDFDEKTENNTPSEDIPKTGKEFYAEYEFSETMDDNSTIELNTTDDTSKTNVSGEFVKRLNLTLANTTDDDEDDDNDKKSSSSANGNSTLDIDDYLSDPEAVRELQEALERMELDLSPKPEEKQGKVRRELRDFQKEQLREGANASPKMDRLLSNTYKADSDRNRSFEKGPMYNMVMKYMPYLKQYENSLSEEGETSKANSICPSLVLVITFCL